MSSSPIHFSRKPYTVVYKDLHTGELIRLKRRPPEKDHPILPTDVVQLKETKNKDWAAGDEFIVKHISYRAPNLLQLQNDKGETTFVASSEVILNKASSSNKAEEKETSIDSRYLIWP